MQCLIRMWEIQQAIKALEVSAFKSLHADIIVVIFQAKLQLKLVHCFCAKLREQSAVELFQNFAVFLQNIQTQQWLSKFESEISRLQQGWQLQKLILICVETMQCKSLFWEREGYASMSPMKLHPSYWCCRTASKTFSW